MSKPEFRSWSSATASARDELAAVFALHKDQKKTLGFLPDDAFLQRAEAGRLLLATAGTDVVGYCLFDLPRGRVKLIHLCVSPHARHGGVARGLVEFIANKYRDFGGIEARCRRDYGLRDFWLSVGFIPINEVPGRGLRAEPLTIWWRRLGSIDLFDSLADGDVRDLAILDTAIVIDLVASDNVDRPQREISGRLESDFVDSRVAFAVSPMVDVELNDCPIAPERVRQTRRSQRLRRLDANTPDAREQRRAEFLSEIPKQLLARDPSLHADSLQLADASLAGATYFVTNDANLQSAFESIARDRFGLQIVTPDQLLSHLVGYAAVPFRPLEGLERNYNWVGVRNLAKSELEAAFLNASQAERAGEFRERLAGLTSNQPASRLDVLVSGNDPLALVATTHVPGSRELVVELVRLARRAQRPPLALVLARFLRTCAVDADADRLVVVDAFVSEMVLAALTEERFRREGERLVCDVIRGDFDLTTTKDRSDFAARSGLAVPEHDLDQKAIADLERRYWPARLWAGHETVTIPIRPRFSVDLFGWPENLIAVRDRVGLSRDNAYFRASRNTPRLSIPTRVLWYCSKSGKQVVRQAFAYSRVTEWELLPIEEARLRYGRLGILSERMLGEIAGGEANQTHVVRFEDTVMLDHPVPLKELRVIAPQAFGSGVRPSPTRVSEKEFRAVLAAGSGQ